MKVTDLFKSRLKVVNVGLEIFEESLVQQEVESVHVVWQPPPKLEKKLSDALDKLL